MIGNDYHLDDNIYETLYDYLNNLFKRSKIIRVLKNNISFIFNNSAFLKIHFLFICTLTKSYCEFHEIITIYIRFIVILASKLYIINTYNFKLHIYKYKKN